MQSIGFTTSLWRPCGLLVVVNIIKNFVLVGDSVAGGLVAWPVWLRIPAYLNGGYVNHPDWELTCTANKYIVCTCNDVWLESLLYTHPFWLLQIFLISLNLMNTCYVRLIFRAFNFRHPCDRRKLFNGENFPIYSIIHTASVVLSVKMTTTCNQM